MTPAGKKNRRVSIMRQGGASGIVAQDRYGQPASLRDQGWGEVRFPWAKIAPQLAGKTAQSFSEGKDTSKVQTLITISYSKSDRITTADLVVFKEPGNGLVHTYDINDIVNVDQKNEEIILICTERDAEA